MAKPKSEDKRNAILSAATQVFAERGLGAPTAAITSAAGIAEGSLFTYFKTKDELINALYRELKLELADSMMSGFPRKQSVRHRLEHVWNGYVHWGVANPDQQKVLKQIQVWGGLTQESKQAGSAPFTEMQRMTEDALTQKIYTWESAWTCTRSCTMSAPETAAVLTRTDRGPRRHSPRRGQRRCRTALRAGTPRPPASRVGTWLHASPVCGASWECLNTATFSA